ncbi:hypothetical protein CIPOMM221M3_00970 [Citrobacter portucalensis]
MILPSINAQAVLHKVFTALGIAIVQSAEKK